MGGGAAAAGEGSQRTCRCRQTDSRAARAEVGLAQRTSFQAHRAVNNTDFVVNSVISVESAGAALAAESRGTAAAAPWSWTPRLVWRGDQIFCRTAGGGTYHSSSTDISAAAAVSVSPTLTAKPTMPPAAFAGKHPSWPVRNSACSLLPSAARCGSSPRERAAPRVA